MLNELIERAVSVIHAAGIPESPKAALILGSGLGGYADTLADQVKIPYSDIMGFPVSGVAGHAGCFVFGYHGSVPVIAMQGRVHYYEGYSQDLLTVGVRTMFRLGARYLVLTNAAGGVNIEYSPGSLMLIKDHICMVPNPLIGENISEFGTRFPDMSSTYDSKLRDIIKKIAYRMDIPLQEGVYVQLTGPSYETPAEVRMVRTIGGDAVGMSTAVEAIAANHMGMHICGISCITNMAAGIQTEPLSHEEVQETADRVADTFSRLVTASIIAIADAIN